MINHGRCRAQSFTIPKSMPLDLATCSGRARRARRLPARLSRHVRAVDDGRERPRDRDPRRARPSGDGRRAVHEGRALSRAHLLGPARAASDAARRPQGRRPLRAHLVGRGARRDRRRASATSPRRPTARRRSCPTATRARWASCSTRRWTAASSTGSGASLLDRTICASAGKAGWTSVIGAAVGMDFEQYENSKLILIWGSNPVTSNLHFWTRAQEAKRRGAKLVAIDPYRSATAEKCHEHIALHAGHRRRARARDDARADRRRSDRPRLRRPLHDRLRRARGARRGVDARARGGAHAASRLRKSWRLRATTAPPSRPRFASTTGCSAWRAAATPCAPSPVCRRWSARGAIPPAAPCSRRPAPIPSTTRRSSGPTSFAARPRTINMSAIGDALLDARDPPVRAIYVYNCNPVAVAPDSGKVRAGFAREDLFCVVHEIFQTDTADFADILLPATTQLEQIDVHTSYGHLYALANNKAIEPLGEALPNTEVFRRLAARMGFTEPCFRDSRRGHRAHGVSPRRSACARSRLGHAEARRMAAAHVAAEYAPFAQGNFPTPSGKCEFASATSRRRARTRCPTTSRRANRRRPTPSWPSVTRSRSSRRRRATSSTRPSPTCRRSSARKARRSSTSIRTTPRARGIADGDRVRIFNDRGSFTATARVGERARQGVVGRTLDLVAEARRPTAATRTR